MKITFIEKFIKPVNSDYFFSKVRLAYEGETVDIICIAPIQPADVAAIVACKDNFGKEAALAVQSELLYNNLNAYISYMVENKITIEYCDSSKEVSIFKHT